MTTLDDFGKNADRELVKELEKQEGRGFVYIEDGKRRG